MDRPSRLRYDLLDPFRGGLPPEEASGPGG